MGFSKKVLRAINKAVRLAKNNQYYPKHSCILLDKRNNEISCAVNLRKSHPDQALWALKNKMSYKIFLHAETHAIIKSKRAFKDAEIHTAICIRVKLDGSFGLSLPCPICLNSLIGHGVKRIIYSDDDNAIKELEITLV
jgi:deoxycytidylate deaminase